MVDMADTTTTAIAEYKPTEAALAELKQLYGATVWDVGTPERLAGAKKARGEIRRWRLDLETERKRLKAPALDRCKAIDTEAKRITAELLELETPVAEAIDAIAKAKKEREEAAKRAEQERIEKARAEIDRIRAIPVDAVGDDSAALAFRIAELHTYENDTLGEFAGVALSARNDALDKLRTMHKAAEDQEAEQARITAEREELEALKAQQAERDQVEKQKRDQEENERREKLAAEERESRERIAAEDALAREAREKADTEARKLRAKAEADEQAHREARRKVEEEVERRELAKRNAEEARLREEREKLEAEQRETAERERKQREAEEAQERERQRLATTRLDAREMLETFVERFGELEEFAMVTEYINRYLKQ
jgi:hypothetical protein